MQSNGIKRHERDLGFLAHKSSQTQSVGDLEQLLRQAPAQAEQRCSTRIAVMKPPGSSGPHIQGSPDDKHAEARPISLRPQRKKQTEARRGSQCRRPC